MSGGVFSMESVAPGVRKTILDIKEISRIHTEEEIYTMLQECAMDPNETVQKLMAQDPFHEVKRKRDKRKENMHNKETADSRWKQGTQRREVRSGRGTFSSRYTSHDAGVARNFNTGKENGTSQVIDKGMTLASSFGMHQTENDSGVPPSSSASGVTNGPTESALVGSSLESGSQMPNGVGFPFGEECSIAETKSESALLPPVDLSGPETVAGVMHGQPVRSSYQYPSPGTGMAASVSGVCTSVADPVLVSSLETRGPGVVSTIKREVASERIVVEPAIAKVASNMAAGSDISSSEKAASEMGSSSIQGKMLTKPLDIDVNDLSDASQPSSSSSRFCSSGSGLSSNYSSRSQQIIGPQKVGPSKEWKPKPTSQIPPYVSGASCTSDAVPNMVEVNTQSASGVFEEAASKLQKKMEELHFSDDQHVIIPNHLQVPESERTGLSFGSFDANFTLGTRFMNGPCSENCSIPMTDSSPVPEDNIEEPILSTQNTEIAQEQDFSGDPPPSSEMPENLSSGEAAVSSSISAVTEYDKKQEAAVAQEGPQLSIVHTAPTYSTFRLIPPMLGGQFSPFESSEPQACEAPPIPSFVVQQPFDPSTGYYTQIYPPGGDGNGRFSPFLAPDSAVKYNGNAAILSSQTGQTSQESANSVVLPSTGSTVVTQAMGVVQTSIPVTQQPLPVFRQPAGMHISHYPPNYIPYQYFSPLYVPPPTIQHFLSNAAFLQQPLAGSIYPPPAAPAAAPVKNSLSQYKTATNSGNSTHSGMLTGYGPYSSTPAGYSPSTAVTSGNFTGNEDITGAQYKENDVYITGQQSEGSAVWVPAPGRDIPSMQTSSLYNLPPQGQHVTFTPLQAGHGAFNGIYHPTQSVAAAAVHPLLQPSQTMAGAVEMVGRPSGVYQQPQRAQINWASNY